jgi:single-strand DNA-binding protein
MYSKTTIIGRLGGDPKLSSTKSGKQICSFNVGVTTGFGNQEKKTDWFRVTTFGGLAENCSRFLKKGSQVFVDGTVHLDTYTDKSGATKASLDLLANSVVFLSKSEN